MRITKKLILRIFFCIELCIFGMIYTYGPHGRQKFKKLENENVQIRLEIDGLKKELAHLEYTIAQWNAEPFYKEQIAREQLQMAGKNETIYYLS